MNEIKVKNVIVSTVGQEASENYSESLESVKIRKIKIIEAKAGNRINIEKDIYFDILWPIQDKKIEENEINNNSIVCKFVYNSFSILFTGDIEETAEKEIVKKYKNFLEATILKVAHHGSKTSSTKDFLNFVKPKIALIGVGENNNFGHPNYEVLERIKNLRWENL